MVINSENSERGSLTRMFTLVGLETKSDFSQKIWTPGFTLELLGREELVQMYNNDVALCTPPFMDLVI